ncbi:MAG: triacylglycerol esterase/lipase EstA (alpha/beta hydrolase family), partial [Myxococcota bacterium]
MNALRINALAAAYLAARLARGVSRVVSAAYHAVDPDARRHIAQMPVLGLTLIARRNPAAVALADDGARPVLCVHGLGGHRGNFTPLRAWLHLFGRTRTYSVGFPRGTRVHQMAELLRAEIATVLRVNGLPADSQVDLVCHSMGGIVAR